MGNKASDRRLNESPTREQRHKNGDRLWEGMHQTAEARAKPNGSKNIGRPKYFSSLIRPKNPRRKSEITLYACLRS